MNNRPWFKKTVAWLLIAAIANPAAMAPAFARDTDIFLTVSGGSNTGEPNILVVLDTSDSMNIPEPWREYPGAYDSHIEYLWNDINIIRDTEQTTEHAQRISTAVAPLNPTSPYGFWAGATLADRQALWTAAKTYANATHPGDPGPRTAWRNYSEGSPSVPAMSWYYWIPSTAATADDSDPRLRSPMFNRFRGYQNTLGGSRGGIAFTGTTSYAGNNTCATAGTQLIPSTVFNPSSTLRNSGKYLNDQWFRWENWLGMDAVNVASYPGSQTVTNGYIQGYLNSSIALPASWSPIPATGPMRDNTGPAVAPALAVATNATNIGQPIRLQNTGTPSAAGWADPKADLGGYEYMSYVNGLAGTTLQSIRGYYGYGLLASVGGAGTVPAEKFSAWRGTRDNLPAAPAFGMTTGTPAYFNITSNPLTACNPLTGPASATCINVATGGTPNITLTKTRACTYVAGSTETDATGTVRRRAGSCTGSVGNVCGVNITCSADGNGVGVYPDITDVPNPAACNAVTVKNNTFNNIDNGPTGSSPATTPAGPSACAWAGRASVAVASCAWSGRSKVKVEGAGGGWFYYGGTCTESGSSQHCNAGGTTTVVNGVSQSNVMGPYATDTTGNMAAGCTNSLTANTYFYGGTCQGGQRSVGTALGTAASMSAVSTANCSISGVTNPLNIRGTNYANAVAGSATNGCNPLGDNNQTCSARSGYGGLQCDHPTASTACPSVQTSLTAGGVAATNNFYLVANRSNTVTNLVHDCKADEPVGNAGGYMRAAPRTWNTAFSAVAPSDASATAPYAVSSGLAVTADANKRIDIFSVNYLNWRFGPKGPTGEPIGRKTRLQIAKDALSDLVQTTDGVRFGLMVFNRTSATLTSEGANVAKRILRMGNNSLDTPDYNNRAALINTINAAVGTARTPLTEALYEAYLYYAGRAPLFGTSTIAAHASVGGGIISQGSDPSALCTTTNASIGCPMAGASVAAPLYKSPMMLNPDAGPVGPTLLGPSTCQRNFVLLITDGGPEDDWSANSQVKALQWNGPTAVDIVATKTDPDTFEADTTSLQYETGGTPYGPTDIAGTLFDGGYVWLDELAHFMSKADLSPGAPNTVAEAGVLTDTVLSQRQSVITYTVGFAGGNSPVLANAALKGGGAFYLAEDSSELSKALIDAIVAIREWNPTVASPSVPISALNRAENGSDVYLSFFKPDPTQAWDGTVKRFRLGTTEAECGIGITLCLTSKVAASSGYLNIEKVDTLPDGTTNIIVDDTAESYWTPTPDGGKPNQGGTGYQVVGNTPSFTPDNRKVYTWLSNVSSSADTTDTNNLVTEANTYTSTNTSGLITKAMLGLANNATTDTAARNAIRYIRGGNLGDVNCTDGNPATVCSWRAWAHADVQHSRPAIVTYDPAAIADTQVPLLQQPATRAKVQYIYYLSNDGLLHAVNADTGKEQWVFLVEEALPKITTLQADSSGEQLNLADGSPTVWISDVNGDGAIDTATDKVYLYFGLRRGGRAYYALDITQRDAPTMLWKISNTTTCGPKGTSCTAAATFSELGQSWSTPTAGNVRKLGAGVPALVFGGGYDPNQDNFKVTSADTMGRALFIVDGRDGTLLRSFGTALGMSYSVPSDPAAINSDLDAQGFLDRVYIGDTGGYVWRFDINNSDPTLWTGKLLANLSSDTPLTVDRRKIMFPPAVVKQNFGVVGRFDAVYVGSGDREHPTKTQATTPATPNDKIFMIKDPDWDVTQPVSATTWTFADLVQLANDSGTGITASALLTAGGWYRDLDSDCTPVGTPPRISCGEKVTSAPTVFFNKLRFGTYTPTAQSNACSPAGEGRLNEIDALTGAFIPLNASSSGTSKDRYYSTFLARGYVSTGQLIVVGKNIYHITVADARLQSILVGTIGAATKIYWYMEPEL